MLNSPFISLLGPGVSFPKHDHSFFPTLSFAVGKRLQLHRKGSGWVATCSVSKAALVPSLPHLDIPGRGYACARSPGQAPKAQWAKFNRWTEIKEANRLLWCDLWDAKFLPCVCALPYPALTFQVCNGHCSCDWESLCAGPVEEVPVLCSCLLPSSPAAHPPFVNLLEALLYWLAVT